MKLPDQKQPIQTVDGVRVTNELYPEVMKLKNAALKDGIILSVASGWRLYDEQVGMRKRNVIDKKRENDLKWLLEADNGQFDPRTAKPGTSNHEFGIAIDFSVNGRPKVYRWLVEYAFQFGWIRTVSSERWHFEFHPEEKNMFRFVPKDHETWDGIIK